MEVRFLPRASERNAKFSYYCSLLIVSCSLIMTPGVDYTGISVSFFCHDGAGNFVLTKRSEQCRDEHHTWEVGGGRLEFGEDPREAVLREVLEEYGVRGVIEKELPPVSLIREHQGTKTHWINMPFIIRVPREGVIRGDPVAMAEIAWFRMNALPTPLHSGMQVILDRHGELITSV